MAKKILFFLIILLSFFGLNFLRLKKVIIISPKEIKGLARLNGQNLLFVNKKKIASRLTYDNREVKKIEIRRLFPKTLSLDFVFREPKVILRSEHRQLYLDEEGVWLPSFRESQIDLPVIETASLVLLSLEPLDWRIIKALSFLKNLRDINLSPKQILIEEKNSLFHLFLFEGTEVITSFKSEPAYIAASLQIIISRFRIEGKMPAKIDFRFDKSIVTF